MPISEKGTFTYRRVIWLEAGLALSSLGYFIDGAKIDILFLIFPARVFISSGGLMMLYGLRLAGRELGEKD
ncbi:MAG: hypothetical protein ACFFB3_11950 [Candidatus Hodarchaeota archaeon]